MRYREDTGPDLVNPYTEGMHAMLTLSVGLALLIGCALLLLGLKGRKLWLIGWSGGLIVCSVIYLGLSIKGLV